jgi:hypothetical protein
MEAPEAATVLEAVTVLKAATVLEALEAAMARAAADIKVEPTTTTIIQSRPTTMGVGTIGTDTTTATLRATTTTSWQSAT